LGWCSTARRTLRACATQVEQGSPGIAERHLGAPQLPCQAVAFDLLGAHFPGDALDLGLDRLKLLLGAPGIGFRALVGRGGVRNRSCERK